MASGGMLIIQNFMKICYLLQEVLGETDTRIQYHIYFFKIR